MHCYRLVVKYNQVALQGNSYIDLWLHSHHSGGWWNLVNSAGEPEQKWLYWNPQNSHFGQPLMSLSTWFTKFSWSPYLQLENAKFNLANFTVTAPFNREINYACIGWHSFLEKNKTKKIAKLNRKNKKQNY